MTLEEIDRKLAELRDSTDRIGSNLLDMELEPNRALLDESELDGASAEHWSAASGTLITLWQWHGALVAHRERAEQLRGGRGKLREGQLNELRELLEGSSLALASDQLPVEERNLLDPSQTALRCTPAQLLELMSARFDEARAVLAAIGKAWDVFVPRLRGVRTSLDECAERFGRVGEPVPGRFETATRELGRLSELLARDPLAVTPEEIKALEASATSLYADIDGLASFNAELANRLGEARVLLDELRRADEENRAAREQLLVKIAAPTVAEPIRLVGIEQELAQVVELTEASAWREARDDLERWTGRTSALLDEARELTASYRAPIEHRNQLRGRLEAYQAKAKRVGLIEDPEISSIFRLAHEVLHTAPSDLCEAERLVRLYQQALSGNPPPEEVLL